MVQSRINCMPLNRERHKLNALLNPQAKPNQQFTSKWTIVDSYVSNYFTHYEPSNMEHCCITYPLRCSFRLKLNNCQFLCHIILDITSTQIWNFVAMQICEVLNSIINNKFLLWELRREYTYTYFMHVLSLFSCLFHSYTLRTSPHIMHVKPHISSYLEAHFTFLYAKTPMNI